ncbi:MAG TPA: hypothetical protein VGH42_01270 [Verrucomicrobiae bacterium]
MINSINKFFASKKAGAAMALLALVIVLASQLSFLSSSLRSDLDSLCIGFAVGLGGFTRAYSDDWKRHKPWGKEFLSKAFFMAYALFVLIFMIVVIKKSFSEFIAK